MAAAGTPEAFLIRRAVADDAEGIVAVLRDVVAERIHSAIDEPFTVEQQRAYLQSLSTREAFHVALDSTRTIVAYQSLDLWSPILPSMSHVGQLGTFLRPDVRRRGLGLALFKKTRAFALSAGYEKFIVYIRGSNTAAQDFYRSLGFRPCGLLARQVRIDGQLDDEVLMEYFL